MKIAVYIISMVAVTMLSAYAFSPDAQQAYGGGGVHFQAGPNLHGCVTGITVLFSDTFFTNSSGTANVSGLPAGKFSVCVENWGAATFTSDGASEISVNVPNNVDCSCP